MSSKIDAMAETLEARRADDEAAAIAAERIRSGAADHKEDGAEALAKLGIEIPEEWTENPAPPYKAAAASGEPQSLFRSAQPSAFTRAKPSLRMAMEGVCLSPGGTIARR